MSSASCLVASLQHPGHICDSEPNDLVNSNDANSGKRKRNQISLQDPDELGGTFTIEVSTTHGLDETLC